MKRKSVAADVSAGAGLGPRQVRVIASTKTRDRVGDIMEPGGALLDNYRKAPTVLRGHDPDCPVGTAEVIVSADRVEALITFDPEGTSEVADTTYAQVKAGSMGAVSIGFNVLEADPLKGGGYHVKRWELMELSVVSVAANPDALIVAKSAPGAEKLKVGASCGLELSVGPWDEAVAARSIFEQADFATDDKNSGYARKGFLVYDDANRGDITSYRFPFAAVVGGRMKANPAGLRSARAAVLKAGLPADVESKALDVIKLYEAKMPTTKIKSLYDVAELAELLQQLGYAARWAEFESDAEGDASAVPTMLAAACRQVAAALEAMTAEEIGEMLAELPGGDGGEKNAKPTFIKALVAARSKAGRAFSSANETALRDACKSIKAGHDAISVLLDASGANEEAGDGTAEKIAAIASTKSAGATRRAREIEILRLKTA